MLPTNTSHCIVVVLFCFICASCNQNSKQADRILKNATSLVEQYPDSTLNLLDSIFSQDLSEAQYYQYILLLIQAKDKSYREITADTLIYKAKNYYEKQGDIKRVGLASFYCGRVLQEKKMDNEAMPYYLDAKKYAVAANNSNLLGLANSAMGVLLSNQFMRSEAIIKFKQAIRSFANSKNHKNEIISYIDVGNCFLLESINDSAFYYYNEALKLTDFYQLKDEQVNVRHNLGVAYQKTGDSKKSFYYLKEALLLTTSELEKARIYLNLAKTFGSNLAHDSASYYIHKSLALQQKQKTENLYLLTSTYNMLSKIEEKNSNYQKALAYHQDYSKHLAEIVNVNSNRTVLDIQKKYDFELLKNDSYNLKLERQNMYLLSIAMLLIVSSIATFFYRKSLKNKQNALKAGDRAFSLMEMVSTFDKKETSFRNTILQHFDILKRAALLESHLKKGKENELFMKRVNKMVYGQETLDWNALYQTMNDLHNGFFDKLHEKYPQLDETEFRICCLLYAKFTSAEIAVITQLSVNTIYAKRTLIRKKIGVEAHGNILDFLNSQLL